MSKKGWIIIGIYTLVLLATAWILFGNKLFPEKKLHYHAGFLVYQNDKRVDFSEIKYMHTMPCGGHEDKELSSEEKQIEKAHLHDYVGDVVHVHREDAKWSDLFTNLKYPIDYSKTKAYRNGQEINDFQNQPIKAYESLVIFIGDNDKKYLQEVVTKEHIVEVEKKSENCGS